jgi:Xaa-Pro aminopeptidase
LESQYVNPEHDEIGKDDGDESKSSEKKYLCFKRLTQIPIQTNLIDVSLMTQKELDWLDNYHQEVFEKVSPLIEEDSPAFAWLKKSTSPIKRS